MEDARAVDLERAMAVVMAAVAATVGVPLMVAAGVEVPRAVEPPTGVAWAKVKEAGAPAMAVVEEVPVAMAVGMLATRAAARDEEMAET